MILLVLILTLFFGQPRTAYAQSSVIIDDAQPLWSVEVQLWELEPYVRGKLISTIDHLVESILHRKQAIADERTVLFLELEEHIFDIDVVIDQEVAALRSRLRELRDQNDFLTARLFFLRSVRHEIMASFGIEA